MPLFYQHYINENAKLAVWHIKEAEEFFLEKVHLIKEIHHPHKRLQHLAGRYLLQILQPGFPLHLIEIDEFNKPLLSNGELHFSISHCGDFAAAIVSNSISVGIDVELIKPKIEVIKNKFLSNAELLLLPEPTLTYITLFWSVKEAVFKWYGNRSVDFKNHIQIKKIEVRNNEGIIECIFKKNSPKDLLIHFNLLGNLSLAWVTG